MQPTEGYSIPRRTLDVEDYIDILRRHKGWIFGPFLLTLVASVVGVYLWPDSYESTATIQIKPQQIAPSLAPVANTQDITDRIISLSNQVMSRSELTAMIRNMNLYPREKNRLPTEDVIEIMRQAIKLTPTVSPVNNGRSLPAFQIRFTYYNRFDANKVVAALVSNFLDEDNRNRNTAMYQTVEFLLQQHDQSKRQLEEAEAAMTEFRLANPGKTPDQYTANLSAFQALQLQQNNLQTQLSQVSQERQAIEGRIGIYNMQIEQMSQETKAVEKAAPRPKSQKLLQAETLVDRADQATAALKRRYSPKHPEVQQMERELTAAKEQLAEAKRQDAEEAAAAAAASAESGDQQASSPAAIAQNRNINGIRYTIKDSENAIGLKDKELERLKKSLDSNTSQISALSARIQSMPAGDQQFQELLRDVTLKKEQFLIIDGKLNVAKMALEVENRKQGEKLDLLDAASLPVDPTDPNRPLVISVGAGLGLVLGLVMAGAREMKDTSLKNLKDVRAYTQMAILGSVPLLENDFVVRRRRRIAWLGWTVACLTAVLVMAGAIVYYYSTR
jgi:uncharacterized protein involved in exopolysaccharide biosynthesis